jgi:hypothetical protein
MHEFALSALLFHSLGTVLMVVSVAAFSCRKVSHARRGWMPIDAAAGLSTVEPVATVNTECEGLELPRAA